MSRPPLPLIRSLEPFTVPNRVRDSRRRNRRTIRRVGLHFALARARLDVASAQYRSKRYRDRTDEKNLRETVRTNTSGARESPSIVLKYHIIVVPRSFAVSPVGSAVRLEPIASTAAAAVEFILGPVIGVVRPVRRRVQDLLLFYLRHHDRGGVCARETAVSGGGEISVRITHTRHRRRRRKVGPRKGAKTRKCSRVAERAKKTRDGRLAARENLQMAEVGTRQSVTAQRQVVGGRRSVNDRNSEGGQRMKIA